MIAPLHYIALCLGCGLLAFTSCRETLPSEESEDYKSLFPFTGISKPETSFEDMTRMPCDPDMALSSYRYMGVDIQQDAREYTVTLRCSITKGDESGEPKLWLRYINERKEIAVASSDTQDDSRTDLLTTESEWVKSFRVRSGYPMYMSVNGVAPRGTIIKASITARSIDGLVVVPTLTSEQAQNKEGPNPLAEPYCQYIILP